MANIVILGAGVMGSALSVPAAVKSQVTLIGSPLDDTIVDSIQGNHYHPDLKGELPENVVARHSQSENKSIIANADVIVIGVSSPGVDWAISQIKNSNANPSLVALITKGLVPGNTATAPPCTYAQHLQANQISPAVGIGGPCIARELALEYPTRVSFAASNLSDANALRDLFQTDYYRITTNTNFTDLEACAALKNFMCIGVSAMFCAYEYEGNHAKNPLAGLFNQAVREIAILSKWIVDGAASFEQHASDGNADNTETVGCAYDLAGMGDLHVTVGGGRNSLLGRHLGQGHRLQHVLTELMPGVTVEGVDTGRQLNPGFQAACRTGALDEKALPLTNAILESIDKDTPFDFDFRLLPD